MEISPARRLQQIGSYAFAEVDRQVAELKEQGIEPVDFGVGDPTDPPPECAREALKRGVELHRTAGYPSYTGSQEYRQTISDWMSDRFKVELDPEREVTSTLGSKEGIFNFPEAFVNPDDVVIIPTPGYPPYTRGTQFAEGECYYMPLLPENDFLLDVDAIPEEVAERAKIMWLNYPNSPTGTVADRDYLEKAARFGQENDIIVASDEAYTEIYYTEERPPSMLEVARDGVIVFQSMSKRSCMTGYRIGWACGDEQVVEAFKKVKTNIDSGTPRFIQDAAVAALKDEEHVQQSRDSYRRKRDMLVDALTSAGLEDCRPEGTIYLWQKVPEGYSSVEFAKELLDPEIAAVTTPGAWLSDETEDGENPGEGFVRFALVPPEDRVEKAAEAISKARW